MFPMRRKFGTTRNNNEWRCCFCLHVRAGTIMFGVWQLALHVLAIIVLTLIMRDHQEFMKQSQFQPNNLLPTPLSKKDDDNPYYLPTIQDRYFYTSDVDVGALMTICTLSITLLMMYGAVKGKANYLLPFFGMQVFDFAVTTLTATGYFCYLRSFHRFVTENWHSLNIRQDLLRQINPQYVSLIILVAFLVSMVWKAYWIGVVWRCYRYLNLRLHTLHNTIHYIVPGDTIDRSTIDSGDYFRDQEAALGTPLKQTPPPSYQDVMEEQPPPYASNINISLIQDGANELRLNTNTQPANEAAASSSIITENEITVAGNAIKEDAGRNNSKGTERNHEDLK